MKKYLFILALFSHSAVFAESETLPLMDGNFTLNGIERPYKSFKQYIGQAVNLEIDIRTHLATNPKNENSLAKDVLEKLHYAKLNAMQGHHDARLKQKDLMQSLLAMGVSSHSLTAMNEFYNDGDMTLILKMLDDKCGQLVAEACFEAGIIAKNAYKSGKAGEYFEKAHNVDVKSAKYLLHLGEIQLQKGNENAEKTFKQGLALEDKIYHMQLLYGLADYHGLMKNNSERIVILRKIANDADKVATRDDKRLLTKTYIQLAKMTYEAGNIKEAEPFADKAIAMGLEHFPDAEIEYISAGYNNLASIYEDVGRTLDAEILYKKAIKIGESFYLERKHMNLARRYYNLGVLYVLDRRFEEGLAYQYKALNLASDKRVEGDLSKTGSWLTGVAITHIHLKNASEAEVFFKKASLFYASYKDKADPAYIQFIESYSDFLKSQGRTQEANALRKNVGQKT